MWLLIHTQVSICWHHGILLHGRYHSTSCVTTTLLASSLEPRGPQTLIILYIYQRLTWPTEPYMCLFYCQVNMFFDHLKKYVKRILCFPLIQNNQLSSSCFVYHNVLSETERNHLIYICYHIPHLFPLFENNLNTNACFPIWYTFPLMEHNECLLSYNIFISIDKKR